MEDSLTGFALWSAGYPGFVTAELTFKVHGTAAGLFGRAVFGLTGPGLQYLHQGFWVNAALILSLTILIRIPLSKIKWRAFERRCFPLRVRSYTGFRGAVSSAVLHRL